MVYGALTLRFAVHQFLKGMIKATDLLSVWCTFAAFLSVLFLARFWSLCQGDGQTASL